MKVGHSIGAVASDAGAESPEQSLLWRGINENDRETHASDVSNTAREC